jgi:hypothetical protein
MHNLWSIYGPSYFWRSKQPNWFFGPIRPNKANWKLLDLIVLLCAQFTFVVFPDAVTGNWSGVEPVARPGCDGHWLRRADRSLFATFASIHWQYPALNTLNRRRFRALPNGLPSCIFRFVHFSISTLASSSLYTKPTHTYAALCQLSLTIPLSLSRTASRD